ncbi:cfem protein, partial [Fusarium langsethiae]
MHAVGWSHSAIGILLDLWMLAIPISQVSKLDLSAERKFRAGIMFTFGFVITVISIIRLQFLERYSLDSQNPTWDYFDLSKWSTIEITV